MRVGGVGQFHLTYAASPPPSPFDHNEKDGGLYILRECIATPTVTCV